MKNRKLVERYCAVNGYIMFNATAKNTDDIVAYDGERKVILGDVLEDLQTLENRAYRLVPELCSCLKITKGVSFDWVSGEVIKDVLMYHFMKKLIDLVCNRIEWSPLPPF